MTSKNLLIVFAKNPIPGKVKTRLAKETGDAMASSIYEKLLQITLEACGGANHDLLIYLNEPSNHPIFDSHQIAFQKGDDLGVKMLNAFQESFELGYEKILLVGSDIPELTGSHIEHGFKLLDKNDFVFGPSKDGGYYLIGMKEIYEFPFKNKQWSTSSIYDQTKKEILSKSLRIGETEVLSDLDTYKDYLNSVIYPFPGLD